MNSRPSTLAELGALVVKEVRPGYAGPSRWEQVRRVVEDGLPVDAVKELQAELKRFGVSRPSEYVDSIVSRATRQRRDRLKPEEGERLVRVASLLALAVDVWGDEDGASAFLTSPHPMLGGAVPIDRVLSEIGARQVESILLALDLGLPV
jgi:putative toxin-antitoxin system antitoxin component (TIGR02293 family)